MNVVFPWFEVLTWSKSSRDSKRTLSSPPLTAVAGWRLYTDKSTNNALLKDGTVTPLICSGTEDCAQEPADAERKRATVMRSLVMLFMVVYNDEESFFLHQVKMRA